MILADRVKETTTTTGNGVVTLAGAATGFASFLAAFGNSSVADIPYCIAAGAEYEVGRGTFNGPAGILARDTVEASSNGGNLVSFSAGTKDVFVTATKSALDGKAALAGSATQVFSAAAATAAENVLRADQAKSDIISIDYSMSGNALTLIIKSGSVLQFRSTTLTTGAPVTRFIPSDISTTISSGSTGGTVSAVQSDIVLIAIDNAGTVEVAWTNLAGGTDLSETGLISTTAEGGAGAADSATVIYSTTARTNVAYRVVGIVRSTQTTAGTWAQTPSLVQGAGGNALNSMMSLGYGQTWQNVTRTSGTTYYNTTGKSITLMVDYTTASNGYVQISITPGVGMTFTKAYGNGGGAGLAIIPVGAAYVLTDTSISARNSYELR